MQKEHKKIYIPKTLFVTIFALVVAVITPRSDALAQRSPGGNVRPPRVTATPTPMPSPTPFPQDLLQDGQIDINNDGIVDIYDYNILVGEYGWSGPSAANPADLNDDGFVDDADFQLLVLNYGFVAPLWLTDESASTVCLPNGTVGINVTFSNTETLAGRSMDVVATDTQTSSFLDMGTVPPQSEAIGTIETGLATLSAGVVVFDLTWTNLDPRVDQRFASYNAISCIPITNTPTPTSTPTPTPTTTITLTTTPTPTTPLSPTPTSAPLSCVSGYRSIEFSNLSGVTSVEGSLVSNQYEGVTFSLENCSVASPRIARTGAPLRSFTSGANLPDQPATGETFGPAWITDSGYFGARSTICTMVISYAPLYRTPYVHLDLLDVDGGGLSSAGLAYYERFNVTGFDANGTVVASQEVLRSDKTYDGRAYRVNLISNPSGVGGPRPAIASVRIVGTSNK